MAETLKASAALDVFSQNQGAILYRHADGWRALESPGPGYTLATDDDGYPYWVEGGSLPFEDSGWIDIPLQNGWYYNGSQNRCRVRQNAAGAVYLIAWIRHNSVSLPSDFGALPDPKFFPPTTLFIPTRDITSPSYIRVRSDGVLTVWQGYTPSYPIAVSWMV